MFRLRGLAGASTYFIRPYVYIPKRSRDARIVSGAVLMVVDATPA